MSKVNFLIFAIWFFKSKWKLKVEWENENIHNIGNKLSAFSPAFSLPKNYKIVIKIASFFGWLINTNFLLLLHTRLSLHSFWLK